MITKAVDSELLKALHPGTGGAKPKCNIEKDGSIWIAKFQSLKDPAWLSIPKLEHACMSLARTCGISVAQTQLQTINDKDVYLVKRFDRAGCGLETRRISYISARSVFYADPGYGALGTGSYARLARWIAKYGGSFNQKVELFKRMVFNCAIRNSDDHEANHGLIRRYDGAYSLSPAFDVLPVISNHKVHSHSLIIGDDASGTIENLMSNCQAFDLNHEAALIIIEDIQSVIHHSWQETFYSAGLGDQEINRLAHLFAPIPMRKTSNKQTQP